MEVTAQQDLSEIAPGIRGFRRVQVSDSDVYETVAELKAENGKYVVDSLTINRIPGGPEVQRGELAKISMDPYVRVAASTIETPPPGRPNLDDLHQLAQAYRWFRVQNGTPTTELAYLLGASVATVRRRLSDAVQSGFLTNEERTK